MRASAERNFHDFPWEPLLAEIRERVVQAETERLRDRLNRLLAAA